MLYRHFLFVVCIIVISLQLNNNFGYAQEDQKPGWGDCKNIDREIQMCWGQGTISANPQNSSVWDFKIQFKEHFKEGTFPAVAVSVSAEDPAIGRIYNVYKISVKTNIEYNGSMITVNDQYRAEPVPTVTYIAVGKK